MLASLAKVTDSDDVPGCGSGGQSRVTFAATSGTTYRIQVDVYASPPGAFTLTWRLLTNDNFGDAIVLPASGTRTDTNLGATKESGEPTPTGRSGGASIWYRYTPPSAGTFTFHTCGTGFDTLLGVYTGAAVNALTPTGADDDTCGSGMSYLQVPVVGGTAYSIEVDGWDQGTGNPLQGAVKVTWQFLPAAPSVTGFSPTAQKQKKVVTIIGSHFTAAQAVGFAKAGGGTIYVTTFTITDDSHIAVVVPSLATTGLVSVGGPGGTALSPTALKIKPTIKTFTPASGPIGTVVTITAPRSRGPPR